MGLPTYLSTSSISFGHQLPRSCGFWNEGLLRCDLVSKRRKTTDTRLESGGKFVFGRFWMYVTHFLLCPYNRSSFSPAWS